jgi:hypothetical protein
MKRLVLIGVVLASAFARSERILLVPVDNRPAAGQFAQMIGAIAGAEVKLPPYEALGQFTRPGSPAKVLEWLEKQDYSDVVAVVVSTDMIAYGGLIASRSDTTPVESALYRLSRLKAIREAHPETRFYAFSAITRILPTATKQTASWRQLLGYYVVMREKVRSEPRKTLVNELRRMKDRLPQDQIVRYDRMRSRNVKVQKKLIEMTASGIFDFLMLGQDDAAPTGPHVRESSVLRKSVANKGIPSKVYFCEGIDQHSNVLVSRALLRRSKYVPRVKVVFSDDDARTTYADFESKPIQGSVEDQLFASGARPVEQGKPYDYILYLNTPHPKTERLEAFISSLENALDQGLPVAVADINLTNHAAADPRVFAALRQDQRATKLLSYAGWNTAGNTVGTSIPAANMVVLGRQSSDNAIKKETAREEFLLHRLVNDFAYHTFTRPSAYRLIQGLGGNSTQEEVYGQEFTVVNSFVRRDLRSYLDRYFVGLFEGVKIGLNGHESTIVGIDGARIFLPWPRAYEVRLEFRLLVQ